MISIFPTDIFTVVLEISIIDIYSFYLKDRSIVILCSIRYDVLTLISMAN